MTSQDRALEIWNGLSPMQRYEYMQRVGPTKGMTQTFRACIKLIASELDA